MCGVSPLGNDSKGADLLLSAEVRTLICICGLITVDMEDEVISAEVSCGVGQGQFTQ